MTIGAAPLAAVLKIGTSSVANALEVLLAKGDFAVAAGLSMARPAVSVASTKSLVPRSREPPLEKLPPTPKAV